MTGPTGVPAQSDIDQPGGAAEAASAGERSEDRSANAASPNAGLDPTTADEPGPPSGGWFGMILWLTLRCGVGLAVVAAASAWWWRHRTRLDRIFRGPAIGPIAGLVIYALYFLILPIPSTLIAHAAIPDLARVTDPMQLTIPEQVRYSAMIVWIRYPIELLLFIPLIWFRRLAVARAEPATVTADTASAAPENATPATFTTADGNAADAPSPPPSPAPLRGTDVQAETGTETRTETVAPAPADETSSGRTPSATPVAPPSLLTPAVPPRTPRSWRASILAGVVGYLLIWPVLSLVELVVSFVRWVVTGSLPERIAHESLRMLSEMPAIDGWTIAFIAGVTVGAPIVEELIYRGTVQAAFRGVSPRSIWLPILSSSALFTVMHTGTVNPEAMLVLFVLSIGFGLSYEWSGRLVTPIIMHGLFNAVNVIMLLALH